MDYNQSILNNSTLHGANKEDDVIIATPRFDQYKPDLDDGQTQTDP